MSDNAPGCLAVLVSCSTIVALTCCAIVIGFFAWALSEAPGVLVIMVCAAIVATAIIKAGRMPRKP